MTPENPDSPGVARIDFEFGNVQFHAGDYVAPGIAKILRNYGRLYLVAECDGSYQCLADDHIDGCFATGAD